MANIISLLFAKLCLVPFCACSQPFGHQCQGKTVEKQRERERERTIFKVQYRPLQVRIQQKIQGTDSNLFKMEYTMVIVQWVQPYFWTMGTENVGALSHYTDMAKMPDTVVTDLQESSFTVKMPIALSKRIKFMFTKVPDHHRKSKWFLTYYTKYFLC